MKFSAKLKISASKSATFAKPQTVSGNGRMTPKRARNIKLKYNDNGIFTE
jgi:hypothetical protein